jgi:hypothetical protein
VRQTHAEAADSQSLTHITCRAKQLAAGSRFPRDDPCRAYSHTDYGDPGQQQLDMRVIQHILGHAQVGTACNSPSSSRRRGSSCGNAKTINRSTAPGANPKTGSAIANIGQETIRKISDGITPAPDERARDELPEPGIAERFGDHGAEGSLSLVGRLVVPAGRSLGSADPDLILPTIGQSTLI